MFDFKMLVIPLFTSWKSFQSNLPSSLKFIITWIQTPSPEPPVLCPEHCSISSPIASITDLSIGKSSEFPFVALSLLFCKLVAFLASELFVSTENSWICFSALAYLLSSSSHDCWGNSSRLAYIKISTCRLSLLDCAPSSLFFVSINSELWLLKAFRNNVSVFRKFNSLVMSGNLSSSISRCLSLFTERKDLLRLVFPLAAKSTDWTIQFHSKIFLTYIFSSQSSLSFESWFLNDIFSYKVFQNSSFIGSNSSCSVI